MCISAPAVILHVMPLRCWECWDFRAGRNVGVGASAKFGAWVRAVDESLVFCGAKRGVGAETNLTLVGFPLMF